jgi:hypothetical protein
MSLRIRRQGMPWLENQPTGWARIDFQGISHIPIGVALHHHFQSLGFHGKPLST